MSGEAHLRADAQRNRRAILQAAARLLADDPSASMQAIADGAGLSRLTLYRRFSGRDELVKAIRSEALAETVERTEAVAASDEPAAEALERLIRELAEVVARYPLLLALFGSGGAAERRKAGPPPWLGQAFDALVERGRRDGTLRDDLRADLLGHVAIGGLIVALKLGHATGREPAEVAAEVAALVLGGARAQPPGRRQTAR